MTVVEHAYAKINLFLDVTGRRDDGFHDILSVMHSVSLCDKITLSCADSVETSISLSANTSEIPTDDSNIIVRVVREYLSYFGIGAQVKIALEKHIPVGAGLGGGSSDGAATLRALNRILGLATEEQLLEIGAKVGSDIPFCLVGGLSLCTGRGEKIQKINTGYSGTFVVAIGEGRISTPKAYAELDLKFSNFSDAGCSGIRKAARTAALKSLSDDGDLIVPYNIFEEVTCLDDIEKIKEIMTKFKAESTMMSGSGPSVFGVFATELDAKSAADALNKKGFFANYCQSVKGEL
jgi:4-diphosphocytidyl-2-C-methyl-D-erythritol kinase